MDICTLVILSTMAMRPACLVQPHCVEADGKQYCPPSTFSLKTRAPIYHRVVCPYNGASYICVRPDGTDYLEPYWQHPLDEITAK